MLRHIGLLLLAVLSGCQVWPPQEAPVPDDVEARFGEPVTLRLHQTARFADGALRLRFDEVVEDSRCPSGVVCFWEGRAVVALRVDEAGHAPVLQQVGLPPEALDAPAHARYQIALQALEPYPRFRHATPPEAYRARLLVTPR